MDTQESIIQQEGISLDTLRAEIAKLDDPHARALGEQGLKEIKPEWLRMYERYTGLQAKLKERGYSRELQDEVDALAQELKYANQNVAHSGDVDESGLPRDRQANFFALVNNKVTNLSLECQRAEFKARKQAAA